MKGSFLMLCGVLLAATLTATAQTEVIPTKVMVRAVSRDAKVIGDGVGGAHITIREQATGKVLAEGLQKGGSGRTDLIMQPQKRGGKVFDTPETAGFLATLMLQKPTVVEIVAEGPLGTRQSTQRVSKTLLLIPGQDVIGEGVILEIHGFTVEFLSPPQGAKVRVGQLLEIKVKVTLT